MLVLVHCGTKKTTETARGVPLSIALEESRVSQDGTLKTFAATYEVPNGTVRFSLELVVKRFDADTGYALTEGALVRMEGSTQERAFLTRLGKELGASNTSDITEGTAPSDRVPFQAIITGTDLSRNPRTGYFVMTPAGGWIATKVFVGESNAEFYLNLNQEEGRAEIQQVSSTHAAAVLREFARIVKNQ